jgi:hypothetical protein
MKLWCIYLLSMTMVLSTTGMPIISALSNINLGAISSFIGTVKSLFGNGGDFANRFGFNYQDV